MMSILTRKFAWIAIGISLLFIVAGVLMHRVIKKVLQAPPPQENKRS